MVRRVGEMLRAERRELDVLADGLRHRRPVVGDLAGQVAYRGPWSVTEALLGQGFNVILDSPCRFEWIVNETTAIAQRQSAAYCFIECVLPDLEELGRRLRSRPRRRSQMVDAGVSSPDAPAMSGIVKQLQTADASVWDTKYPASPWLQLDTRENAERCFAQALAYLDQRRHGTRTRQLPERLR